MTLLIDNDVAMRTITMPDAVDALEQTFAELGRGDAVDRNKTSILVPHDEMNSLWYRYASMEGASRVARMLAVRIKTDMVRHVQSEAGIREEKYTGAPGTYGGLILLFSTEDGRLLAIFNDGYLQHLRVGASYGVGAKYLARADASSVGIIGSGGMARSCLDALCAVREIRIVKVFSPTLENADLYAKEMSEAHDIEVRVVGGPSEAASDVDILMTTTNAREPILFPDMIERGMHVAAVTESCEMSPHTYQRFDAIVTECTDISVHLSTAPEREDLPTGGSGPDILKWHAVVPAKRVVSLHDVILGKAPGRLGNDEVTFFASEGMGTQFVAVAGLAYLGARQQGLGREMPDEWFLQDIRS